MAESWVNGESHSRVATRRRLCGEVMNGQESAHHAGRSTTEDGRLPRVDRIRGIVHSPAREGATTVVTHPSGHTATPALSCHA
jgi:hypothetical protein